MSMHSDMDFNHLEGSAQENVAKAIDLVKYVLVDFSKTVRMRNYV
jgi:hypothetical protein